MAGNEAGVTGHRHGSRKRSLTGTFEADRDRGAETRPADHVRGRDCGMEEPSTAGAYQRRTLAADALIAGSYLRAHQYAGVASRLAALFGGTVGQGHGEPDLAQGEERLGRLEQPFAGR